MHNSKVDYIDSSDRMIMSISNPYSFLESTPTTKGGAFGDTTPRTLASAEAPTSHHHGSPQPNAGFPSFGGRGKVRLSLDHGPRNEVPQWQPTRMTSSYRVLSAAGLQDDFYTSNLAWGKENVALALKDYLLIFRPNQPRQKSLMASLNKENSGRYPTSVVVSRYNDLVCFLGHSDGVVQLYGCPQGGNPKLTQQFITPSSMMDDFYRQLSGPPVVAPGDRAHPTSAVGSFPPHLISRVDARWQQYNSGDPHRTQSNTTENSNYLSSSNGEPSPLQVVQQTLTQMAPAVNGIMSATTTSTQPWSAALATSFSGVVVLDTRQKSYTNHFGNYMSPSPGLRNTLVNDNRGPSEEAHSLEVLQQLRQMTTSLMRQDRLCSISWNCNGSLLATGSNNGIVRVWAVGNTRTPLHEFSPFRSGTKSTVIKALMFHPTRPYELAVGDSSSALPETTMGEGQPRRSGNLSDASGLNAFPEAGTRSQSYGKGGVLLFDVSGSVANCTASGWTAAPTVQVLYSPDGEHLVTAHGQRNSVADGLHRPPHNLLLRNANHSLLHSDVQHRQQMGNPTLEVTLRQWPSHSLMVWRRTASGGSQGRNPFSALFSEEDGDGVRSSTGSTSSTERARYSNGEDPTSHSFVAGHPTPAYQEPSPAGELLLPLYAMAGHRSRPLSLASPFPSSSHHSSGCVASLAGGDDSTIRFWRVFHPIRSSSQWERHHNALVEGAITPEDMENCREPTLR